MTSLSPLVISNLRYQISLCDEGPSLTDALRKKKARTLERVVYECGDCTERYEFESAADQCCMPEPVEMSPYRCPVCREGCEDTHAAADCCLWKDISPADRARIAGTVRAGASWADAIATVTGDNRVLS